MEADHYQLKLLLVLPPYVKAEDLPEPLADFAAELKKAERFSLAHTCAFNGGGACTVDDEQNLSQALSTLGLEEPWQPMPRIPVPDDQQCCSCSPLDTSDIPNVPTVDVKAADTIAPPPDVMVEVVDAAQEISAEDMGDSDVQAERQDAVDASQELADATTQPAPPAVLNHFILLDRSKSVPQESLTDLLGRVTARIGCFVEPQDRIIFVPFATDYKPSAAGRGSEMMRAAHHVVDSLAREKTCLQAALAWCFGAQAEALMEEGDVPADVLAESPPCDSSDDDLVRRTLHEEFAKLRTDEGRVLWVYSDFKDDPAADLRRNLKAALRERRRDRPVVLVPLLATPTGCRDLERFVEPLRRELPVLGDSKRLLLP